MHIAVIGAGLSGLSAAYELSKKGFDVTIFEESDIGGLASSYLINNYSIEKYYHHIFRSDRTILELIHELELDSKLEWLKGTTGYCIKGKIYPLNTPKEILQFPYLSFSDKVKLGLLVLRSKMNKQDLDSISAKNFIINNAGKSVYYNFFEPLLNSKFGSSKDNVSASWLLSRIKIRSDRSISGEKLGYMKGGFVILVEAILAILHENNVEFIKNPVTKITSKNNQIKAIEAANEVISCDKVISTIPLNNLNKIINAKIGSDIRYQGSSCAVLALNTKLFNDIYWLNIKADVPFGAVIEHTNFVPLDYYREHIVYIASYFQDENDPLWKMSEEDVIDLYVKGLQDLFPTFDKSSINWWKLTRDIYAAPVFEKGFKSKILPYKTSINGLYVAGMFSLPNYPERTMNGSIRAGIDCADELILESTAFAGINS